MKEKCAHVNATKAEDPKVAKFVKDQCTECSHMIQGKETQMIQDKMDELQSLGFDFQHKQLINAECQKWEEMPQEFKAHHQNSIDTTEKKTVTSLERLEADAETLVSELARRREISTDF